MSIRAKSDGQPLRKAFSKHFLHFLYKLIRIFKPWLENTKDIVNIHQDEYSTYQSLLICLLSLENDINLNLIK